MASAKGSGAAGGSFDCEDVGVSRRQLTGQKPAISWSLSFALGTAIGMIVFFVSGPATLMSWSYSPSDVALDPRDHDVGMGKAIAKFGQVWRISSPGRATFQGPLRSGVVSMQEYSREITETTGDEPEDSGDDSEAEAVVMKPKKKSGKSKRKEPKSKKVKGPVAPVVTQKSSIAPEQDFWTGAPSPTEVVLPGLSIFTVVGLIPFSTAVARQVWTRYRVTTRRIQIASGFRGKDIVQVIWREITDIKWLRRWGGASGDVVFTLTDKSKVEVRSIPEFDSILAFMMDQIAAVNPDVVQDSFYPDELAATYLKKVKSGEEKQFTIDGSEAKLFAALKKFSDEEKGITAEPEAEKEMAETSRRL